MNSNIEKTVRIISSPTKENPFVVLYKPHNLPSAPLHENDTENALYQASLLFPEINNVKGRKGIEKGLVHRLDTVTGGLLLICTDQAFYDRILEIQNNNQFIKTYRAVCDVCKDNVYTLEGFPPVFVNPEILRCNETVCTKSYFRGFGNGIKEVRPVTEDSGMAALKKVKNKVLYETEIRVVSNDRKRAEVLCTISKGYRHQVRCHLAWCGLPCVNDPLYNSKGYDSDKDIMFEACSFVFPHPFTGEEMSFTI